MPKVNAEVANAPALLQTGNAILMFVGIVGSGELFIISLFSSPYFVLGKILFVVGLWA